MPTIEKEVLAPVKTEAAPLTSSEANSLIAMAAAAEKRPTVPAGTATTRSTRAWSLGGRVD